MKQLIFFSYPAIKVFCIERSPLKESSSEMRSHGTTEDTEEDDSPHSTVKSYQICQTLFCKQFYYNFFCKKDLEQANKQTNKQTNQNTILNPDCSRLHICHDYTLSNLFSPSAWFLVHMNKSNQLLFMLSVTLLCFYVVL